jgi:hypothetical protein
MMTRAALAALLLLPACARHHVCDAPEPAGGMADVYHWEASAGDCVPYHAAVEALDGLMLERCDPVDWCGDSGTFACQVPTGTLVYSVALTWDGAELHGDGVVTRLDLNGAVVCEGDVTVMARPAEL